MMIYHTCMSIDGAIINAKMLKGCITVDGRTLETKDDLLKEKFGVEVK